MTDLYSLFSDNEVDMMNYYIDQYTEEYNVTSSAGRASLQTLLEPWNKNKQTLYKLLGNNLTVSKTFDMQIEPNKLSEKMDLLFDTEESGAIFYRNLQEWVAQYPLGYSDRQACRKLFDLLGSETLANNKWSGSSFSVPRPDGKRLQVQSGCKPIKILCEFAKYWNIKGAEAFRLDHSRVLNNKKYKGTLTLSIHPLDYMTMSDNDSGWDSCMSWVNKGCYRQGTVEMMNSPCVVVAYLASKSPYVISSRYGYEWNNKKWRELFIINKDVIAAVKGYPYQSQPLATNVIAWLADLAKKNLGWNFSDTITYTDPDCNFEYNGHTCQLRTETGNMYNDFGRVDENYLRLGQEIIDHNDEENVYVYYSGPSECMYCGSTNVDFDGSSALVCTDCYEATYCYVCDQAIDPDEIYELDGHNYCEDCYNDHAIETYDGEVHDIDNCYQVFLARAHFGDEVNINEDNDSYIWVYDDYAWRHNGMKTYFPNFNGDQDGSSYFHEYRDANPWGYRGSYHYLLPDECNTAGLWLFGLTENEVNEYVKGQD